MYRAEELVELSHRPDTLLVHSTLGPVVVVRDIIYSQTFIMESIVTGNRQECLRCEIENMVFEVYLKLEEE